MKNPIDLKLDIYNACRTNTGRALNKDDNHYNLSFLADISGANFERLIKNLQWCAEHQKDDMAIDCVAKFAEALLSAYEIQSNTYK